MWHDGRNRFILRSPLFWLPFVITLVVTTALMNPDLVFVLLASPNVVLGVVVVTTVGLIAYSRHLDHLIEENDRELKRLEDELKYWKKIRDKMIDPYD